jgi:hypothetical protein
MLQLVRMRGVLQLYIERLRGLLYAQFSPEAMDKQKSFPKSCNEVYPIYDMKGVHKVARS